MTGQEACPWWYLGILVPEGITEAKDVILHYNLQACNDSHMGDTNTEGRHSKEVGFNFQGVVCINVGIH
jgi:hypothetical protein